MLEIDLFPPVKKYLENQGYSVNAEVKDCDVTARKDDELIIVELKTSANMQLLIQATDRLNITSGVYVAIPAVKKNSKHWRGIQRVIRRLELGLLVVSSNPGTTPVRKLFDPGPFKKTIRKKRRQIVINEIDNRSAEYNIGGSSRVKLVTAYRENAILIATGLNQFGDLSPKSLKAMGTGEKTGSILAKNYYGWFERVAPGVYSITQQGRDGIASYPRLQEKSIEYLQDQSKIGANPQLAKK